MRYAILADIHSNLPALEMVLDAAEKQNPERYLCLGDVVGYGADPGPCLERLAELSIVHIQGNHEARLLSLPTPGFSQIAEAAIEYNREKLDSKEQAFLREFPMNTLVDDLLLVHGSPDDRDEYVRTLPRMQQIVEAMTGWICFCGHTHIQYLYCDGSIQEGPAHHELRRETKYLVNPGSVGQPRDGDPRAAYGILDTDALTLDLHRVEYDIDRAASRIRAAGLPAPLADRLCLGR